MKRSARRDAPDSRPGPGSTGPATARWLAAAPGGISDAPSRWGPPRARLLHHTLRPAAVHPSTRTAGGTRKGRGDIAPPRAARASGAGYDALPMPTSPPIPAEGTPVVAHSDGSGGWQTRTPSALSPLQ